jgi:Zn-dependent protease with chaperone function
MPAIRPVPSWKTKSSSEWRAVQPRGGADPALSDQELLDALRGQIPPISPPIHYRLALVLVALAMILLPLIYVALVVAAGAGVVYYAAEAHVIFDSASGRGLLGALLIYLGPLIIGGIFVLFLVKPLFARPDEPKRGVRLERNEAPLLFTLVERLREIIGAPRFSEIRINYDVNASASFPGGALAFLGRDLVLTIGLPLIEGMTLRQLVGVLAHELGHFGQSAGMRLTYVIRSVNAWFHRVVFERDSWDAWLIDTSRAIDLRIGIIFYLARLCVWLTRQLLKLLMIVGHLISSLMLRQMEFDADRYEVCVAGSKVFASTFRRLTELTVYLNDIGDDLHNAYSQGRLPDNVIVVLMGQKEQVSAEVLQKAIAAQLEEKTNWWDTHPSASDRIAAAERGAQEGIFRLSRPASVLLSDPAELGKRVTREFYDEHFDAEDLNKVQIVSAEAELQQQVELEGARAIARFSQGHASPLRPLRLPERNMAHETQEATELLQALRASVLERAQAYRKCYEQFDQADDRLHDSLRSEVLLDAGFRLQPGQFGLSAPDRDGVAHLRRGAHQAIEESSKQMAEFEELIARRLATALGLVASDAATQRLAVDGVDPEVIDQLWRVADGLSARLPKVNELTHTLSGAMILAEQFSGGQVDEQSVVTLKERVATLARELQSLVEQLDGQTYPFEYRSGETVTIGRFAFPDGAPDAEDIAAVLNGAGAGLSRLFQLYGRVLSRLMAAAEKVEQALGLEPLPEVTEAP